MSSSLWLLDLFRSEGYDRHIYIWVTLKTRGKDCAHHVPILSGFQWCCSFRSTSESNDSEAFISHLGKKLLTLNAQSEGIVGKAFAGARRKMMYASRSCHVFCIETILFFGGYFNNEAACRTIRAPDVFSLTKNEFSLIHGHMNSARLDWISNIQTSKKITVTNLHRYCGCQWKEILPKWE